MLNVLMQNRPDAETCPGGDTVQMHRSAAALRQAGHHVRLSLELRPDLRGVDVVHLFNLTRPHETFQQAENARRAGVPYVLSPVYWDLESAVPWRAYEFPRNWYRLLVPGAMRESLRGMICSQQGAEPEYLQEEILRGAARVFPNSIAERDHLGSRFGGPAGERLIVVLNGIDPPADANGGADGPHATGEALLSKAADAPEWARGAFVCAGAIGPRKNQLGLVRAFRALPDERLVIVGPVSPGSGRYMRAVRRAAGANVEFRDGVPHAEMSRVWHAAKACVQPSWIETPGLSAMEAAAAGTPIVVADVPPVREYFSERAFYCEPGNARSIGRACEAGARAGRCDGSAFAAKFTWERVLRPLVDAYGELEDDLRDRRDGAR